MPQTNTAISVFFFGDSICWGQGVSPHAGWVGRISQHLDAVGRELGRPVLVANAGVNGNTTRLALERMHHDVLSHGCDVLLAQFGMNDCNYWRTDNGVPRVSPAAFRANLHEIFDRARAHGVRRLFLNTNHPSARFSELPPSRVRYQDSNARYNELARQVAGEREDVRLIDIEREFQRIVEATGGPTIDDLVLPQPDMLHLSLRGHALYFELVSPVVEAAVRELSGG
jgi:lysophospholipase L1-like esterase